MALLTVVDSRMPPISSSDSTATMPAAGRFATPPWLGAASSQCGRSSPQPCSRDATYCDQDTATVAAPTAYSSTRSQPMIHATNSPRVA